jgi:cytochrome c556
MGNHRGTHRRRIRPALLVGLALGATLLVAAGGDPAGDALIPARQAAFRLSGTVFGGMKPAIDRGDDVKTLVPAAKALAGWARALPGLFPAGSDGAATKALPNVWSDKAGFAKAAATYADAADKLATLAAAGDQPGFATQWGVVRQSCKACHDSYHAPMPH